MSRHDFVTLPSGGAYTLRRARIPLCCIEPSRLEGDARDSTVALSSKQNAAAAAASQPGDSWDPDVDGLVVADVSVEAGSFARIRPAQQSAALDLEDSLDMGHSMLLPTFVDMHTHIGAGRCPPCGVHPLERHCPPPCRDSTHTALRSLGFRPCWLLPE